MTSIERALLFATARAVAVHVTLPTTLRQPLEHALAAFEEEERVIQRAVYGYIKRTDGAS